MRHLSTGSPATASFSIIVSHEASQPWLPFALMPSSRLASVVLGPGMTRLVPMVSQNACCGWGARCQSLSFETFLFLISSLMVGIQLPAKFFMPDKQEKYPTVYFYFVYFLFFKKNFFFQMRHSWFTILYNVQVYSTVIHNFKKPPSICS